MFFVALIKSYFKLLVNFVICDIMKHWPSPLQELESRASRNSSFESFDRIHLMPVLSWLSQETSNELAWQPSNPTGRSTWYCYGKMKDATAHHFFNSNYRLGESSRASNEPQVNIINIIHFILKMNMLLNLNLTG